MQEARNMMKEWLLHEVPLTLRPNLQVGGNAGEWGAGEAIEEEKLPPVPTGVVAKSGNGRITISWDPVPDAMYYNLYFLTSKGVSIKFSELTRPIASAADFKPVIGVKKDKGNCIEGAASPYVHDDLANGTCYHYVVTVVTPAEEGLNSAEVWAAPSPNLVVLRMGEGGVGDGGLNQPPGMAWDREGKS